MVRYKIISFLLLIIVIFSAILSFVPIKKACSITFSGCSEVQNSIYENIFFGVSNATIGLIAFSILLIVCLWQIKNPSKIKNQILTLGLFVGFIFAIYFIYLQLFVLKAICEYCIVIDIGAILSFLIIVIPRKDLNTIYPTFNYEATK